VQTYDLLFRSVFVFFIIELGSRRVVHFGTTRSPTDAWVAQPWRNATPFGEGPQFLICGNDQKYGANFARVTQDVDIPKTPVRALKANAVCERFNGNVTGECLDHVIILGERYLRRLVCDYITFFNTARPHQGIVQQIPVPPASRAARGPVRCRNVLGGIIHDYYRDAA
jgi:putative transposase